MRTGQLGYLERDRQNDVGKLDRIYKELDADSSSFPTPRINSRQPPCFGTRGTVTTPSRCQFSRRGRRGRLRYATDHRTAPKFHDERDIPGVRG